MVVVVFALVTLLGAAGLAVDASLTFYKVNRAEHAAQAAALAGAAFMPNNFQTPISPGTRQDARDRALDTAQRDGFDASSVTVLPVAGHPDEVAVTVSVKTDVVLLKVVGGRSSTITRTAYAQYQPCIGPHLLPDASSASTASCTATVLSLKDHA
jgi:hypothetical protein